MDRNDRENKHNSLENNQRNYHCKTSYSWTLVCYSKCIKLKAPITLGTQLHIHLQVAILWEATLDSRCKLRSLGNQVV